MRVVPQGLRMQLLAKFEHVLHMVGCIVFLPIRCQHQFLQKSFKALAKRNTNWWWSHWEIVMSQPLADWCQMCGACSCGVELGTLSCSSDHIHCKANIIWLCTLHYEEMLHVHPKYNQSVILGFGTTNALYVVPHNVPNHFCTQSMIHAMKYTINNHVRCKSQRK